MAIRAPPPPSRAQPSPQGRAISKVAPLLHRRRRRSAWQRSGQPANCVSAIQRPRLPDRGSARLPQARRADPNRHDRQRLGLQVQALCQAVAPARHQAKAHATLHAAHQMFRTQRAGRPDSAGPTCCNSLNSHAPRVQDSENFDRGSLHGIAQTISHGFSALLSLLDFGIDQFCSHAAGFRQRRHSRQAVGQAPLVLPLPSAAAISGNAGVSLQAGR